MILKLADLLDTRPYNLSRGANALRVWVEGRQGRTPLHPLPLFYVGKQVGPRPHSLCTPGTGGNAKGIEPPMATISVKRVSDRVRLSRTPPSPEAVFVASLVKTLMCDHAYAFDRAVAIADTCWSSLDPRFREHTMYPWAHSQLERDGVLRIESDRENQVLGCRTKRESAIASSPKFSSKFRAFVCDCRRASKRTCRPS